ncbi:hypothetical protein K3G63_13710 [Hymenobacter sp. HSC-4F20]|uniref:type VI secretion system tube protein TssD n=1 Tax=Hymenobacter sp. HSC-4F20 TaxID=2864135 RepID=UPI001C72D3AD|nr:hypothetical protein [Hymenobacter sp. HSC-4F20]
MAATPELVSWIFNGRTYKVLQGHYGFHQGIDYVGRPSTTVRPQVVTLTLDASDEDARLSSYVLDPLSASQQPPGAVSPRWVPAASPAHSGGTLGRTA